MSLDITLIQAFQDNYIFAFQTGSDRTVIVDPGDAKPVIEYLNEHNLRCDIILLTHHHHDHIGGVAALVKKYGAEVWGPATETKRIPGMDKHLEDGQTYALDDLSFDVMHTPGHTLGHICLYFKENEILFCGDTLFSLGCGRVFEGTMEQMHNSLQRLAVLPDETSVYCAHEYTAANARFAHHIAEGKEQKDLERVMADIAETRANDMPTIPSVLAFEKEYNPFLKAKDATEFEKIRRVKDAF